MKDLPTVLHHVKAGIGVARTAGTCDCRARRRKLARRPSGGHADGMKLTAVFEPAKEGGFVCWFEEMPGVQSQGDSLEEARANLLDALKLAIEYLRDRARQESSPQSFREEFEVPAI